MARQSKAIQQQSLEGPRLTGCVTRTHGRHHYVTTVDGNVYEAHRRGKKSDVVVGDIVICSQPSGGVVAIESIEPRTNLLYRSDEWRIKELASNLTLVACVFASRPTFNPKFVWKAIVAAQAADIPILVIRNKSDLSDKAQEAEAFLASLQALGVRTLNVSALSDPEGTRKVLSETFAGERVLLMGQSGMGKSTILNVLCPEAQARTQEFSEALDLGKQTTTNTTLYSAVFEGKESALIDSPGFQEFGLAHLTKLDVLRAMPDIAACVDGCRFYNCTHTSEPGCSVKAALAEGRIQPERYAFYCELVASCEK